jgi:iron complex outermembrane receptor protein
LFYINPSLLFSISPKTKILIEGDVTKYETTPDFGAGIINYEIVEIPRDRFLGVSWGKYKANQNFVSSSISHQLNKSISINSITGFRFYNTELFANARPNSAGSIIASNGNWKRNIQRSAISDRYFIQQFDVNSAFRTGFIKHQVLVGADFENFTTSTLNYNNFSKYDSVNVFNNYDSSLEPVIPTLTKNTNTDNPVARMGYYIQDLISFPKYFKILAGLRYSSITSTTNTFKYSDSTSTNVSKTDVAYSPKFGLVFQPNDRQTLFVSYSNSFVLNAGVDIIGAALAPSIVDQYEIGVKNKFYNNCLSIQLTAYQITNSNLAQISLVDGNSNSNIKELSGATESKGVELDLIYQPNPFLYVMGGYSFTKSIYTKSNTYIIGSELRYNPKHTANMSVNYSIHKGWLKNTQLGLLSTFIGDRYAGRST